MRQPPMHTHTHAHTRNEELFQLEFVVFTVAPSVLLFVWLFMCVSFSFRWVFLSFILHPIKVYGSALCVRVDEACSMIVVCVQCAVLVCARLMHNTIEKLC